MRKIVNYILLLVFIQCYTGCLEVYNPPEIRANDSYLVVEGFLNVTERSCTIKLTRTQALSGDEEPQGVDDITVVVEDEDDRRFILAPQSNGVYTAQGMLVQSNGRYRLRIEDGSNTYLSAYVDVSQTPPIDKVTWKLEDDKVRFYVSTHNTNEGTRHYQWRFDETWEYHTAFRSYYKLQGQGNIVERGSPDELYYCWKSERSSTINLGTTMTLDSDVISDYLLHELPMTSGRLETKYSILVSQFSVSREEYDFWSQVRDNTVATGSLFDVQPSRIKGNIACENCDLPILGYFSANTVQQKRIFVRSSQLPLEYHEYDTGYENCREDSLLKVDIPMFKGPQLIVDELIEVIEGDGPVAPDIHKFLGYWVTQPYCVDCRIMGGVTTRPPFWN
jgi:hypothetical protein